MADKRSMQTYLKYAGAGIEILACILLFVGFGYFLDQSFQTSKPYFLLVASLIGSSIALYLLIRKFNKPSQ